MSVMRWNPFQDLDAMERRMRRFFDDAGIAPAPLPAADVYETEGEYVFELEVPGFDEKELAVEVSDHTLTVTGKRTETKDEKGKTFSVHERLAKEFERRFVLPADADAGRLGAEFKAGVLTVHASKDKASKPRKVTIAAG
jgi:HSP20 family protein